MYRKLFGYEENVMGETYNSQFTWEANMNYELPIISVLISSQQNKGDLFNLNIHLRTRERFVG